MTGSQRSAVEHRALRVRDIELHLFEAGPPDGPAVLLLHGFPDSAVIWRHQIDALAAAGFRVVAPDLPGYGRSSKPAAVDRYRLAELVADMVGLLAALGLRSVAVVGHDWGAVLAWRLALARPQRVSRLVALSVGHPRAVTAGGLAQAVRSRYMLAFLVPGLAERVLPLNDWATFRRKAWGGAAPGYEPDADRQIAEMSQPGALTAGLSWYRANLRPRVPSRVRTRGPRPAGASASGRAGPPDQVLHCPVLGVWSSDDPFLTEAQMTASARWVDGGWRYERLDGVDHWVQVHAANRLNALLLEFLG
jgi:pimeloyl-ACP methyl ester carboxylesterase